MFYAHVNAVCAHVQSGSKINAVDSDQTQSNFAGSVWGRVFHLKNLGSIWVGDRF